jgi:hypothetical protein
MANSRGFFLGDPPFRFLAGHLAQDEDFLSDARSILRLDQDAYTCLASRLRTAETFLDRPSLVSIISQILGESEESRDLASIIYRIGGMLHDADMPADDAMDELGKAIAEKAVGLEPQDRQVLVDRLRALAAEPLGLGRQYKARQLVDALGSELDEAKIICDLRPIFDQDRERVEGALPLTVLRLEYTSPKGDAEVVEVRITEKQLEELGSAIATAKRKVQLIKELIGRQGLPIPRTKATVTEEEP